EDPQQEVKAEVNTDAKTEPVAEVKSASAEEAKSEVKTAPAAEAASEAKAENAEQESKPKETPQQAKSAETSPDQADPSPKEEKKEAKPVDPEREAKIKAAAERRAAREKAKAAEAEGGEGAEEEAPKPPSPNQPKLDRLVEIVKTNVSEDAIEEAYLNERHHDQPTIIVRPEHLVETDKVLRDHEALKLNYLRNLSGVDYETHLETVYHMISLETKENYGMKVKTDREQPQVPSVTSVWATADWNEREIYD